MFIEMFFEKLISKALDWMLPGTRQGEISNKEELARFLLRIVSISG
jgi:hypothetical protein